MLIHRISPFACVPLEAVVKRKYTGLYTKIRCLDQDCVSFHSLYEHSYPCTQIDSICVLF